MTTANILRWQHCPQQTLVALLERYTLQLVSVESKEPIPGSFWGEEEAGLIASQLFVRPDTPVHSVLHEACHYICMTDARRKNLHTNAGGSYAEENAVCFLQIVLSDQLPWMLRPKMFQDMDSWGYNFRLGSAQRWFEEDAEDAAKWLIEHQVITEKLGPTFSLRH